MGNEIYRKILHVLIGIFVIVLIYFDVMSLILFLVLDIISVVLMILNVKDIYVPVYSNVINKCGRMKGDYGLFTFMIGCTLTFAIFPKNISLTAISIFVFGDAVASLIGIRGKIKSPLNNKKNIEGFIVSFFVAFGVACIFTNWIYALIVSFLTMLIEHINSSKLDDNLFLAPIAGVIMCLMNIL